MPFLALFYIYFCVSTRYQGDSDEQKTKAWNLVEENTISEIATQ